MVWLRIILIINVLWTSGCVSSRAIHKNKAPTMMDIYANSTGQAQKDVTQFIEHHLKEQETFGYVKPYIPVINEPVVRKVWIPDHKSENNSDVMIAGHWVYLMIQPPTWFIDGKIIDSKMAVIIPSAKKNLEH
jgi:hypothetical protein